MLERPSTAGAKTLMVPTTSTPSISKPIVPHATRYQPAPGAMRAIVATKMTVNLGLKQIATAVMDASIAYEILTVHSEDHAEAVHAFLEKRDPVFKGK